MTKDLYTSDIHFNHPKVAALRGFASVAEHDEAIVENWNSVVAPGDRVFVLGDITVGRPSYVWPYLARMHGRKELILGNHDAPFSGHRDSLKHTGPWHDHFASVRQFGRMRMEGGNVLLAHHPYEGDSGPVDRDVQYRLRDEGLPVIHGHVHGNGSQVSWTSKGTLQVHVGLDDHDLKPVPASWVMAKIRECKAAREVMTDG